MKKSSLVILAALAVLVAAGLASLRLAQTASPSAKPSSIETAAPCGTSAVAQYGHIESLTRNGDHFEIRFDPAWYLTGVTATRAALEDTGSGDVPNDAHIVEESHRAYTYLVPASAHVTVLTRSGKPDFGRTTITVEQLAQLVKGEEPVKLFESLESGLWMKYYNDTVCSLDQQYRP